MRPGGWPPGTGRGPVGGPCRGTGRGPVGGPGGRPVAGHRARFQSHAVQEFGRFAPHGIVPAIMAAGGAPVTAVTCGTAPAWWTTAVQGRTR
ncbi:hypothetical protein CVV68_02305 [Arthrobacter livingstonensis]|uniref:Uncharacterized protein n=1 Tax=Arthrobacter livingstonensis TaxID=670078 RepID=A0A2V5LN87_9MICC|nr:hypothetical protein CVV68_02305 [Arthrobacter livingstonensis]